MNLCYNNAMKKKILGLCVTALFFAFILYKIDLNAVVAVIKDFSPTSLCYIVLFYVMSLLLRGLRWKLFLANSPKYSWLQLAEIFTIGTMLNIFLPARAGDVYRAYYLGSVKAEKKLKIFGSVILERLFDGTALFFVLLFAVTHYFKNSHLINTTVTIAGSVFIGSLIVAFILFRTGSVADVIDGIEKLCPKKESIKQLFRKLRVYTLSFVEGFEVLSSLRASCGAFSYSVAIWVLECVVTFLIINSFGVSFPISASLFVLSLITFSTMIPSTSIFLGPFQAAYILALGIYGVDKEFALAISVVHNVILTAIVTVIGLLCLLKNNPAITKNNTNG